MKTRTYHIMITVIEPEENSSEPADTLRHIADEVEGGMLAGQDERGDVVQYQYHSTVEEK